MPEHTEQGGGGAVPTTPDERHEARGSTQRQEDAMKRSRGDEDDG